MNDPVIDRIAREDPAVGCRSDTAGEMLARLRHEIGRADPPPVRGPARDRLVQAAVPVAAAVVTVLVSVAAVGLLGHRSHASSSAVRSVRAVLPVAVGSVRVIPGTEVLRAQGGSLWVAGAHSLERLSPRSGAVEAQVRLPTAGIAVGLAFGAGGVWVASGGGNTGSAPSLARIDPASGRILATINVTGSGVGRQVRVLNGGISFAAGRVWISRDSPGPYGDVVSINPATNRVDGRPVTVGTGPVTVLAAFGALWVDDTGRTIGIRPAPPQPASVTRIDPRTRRVTTEPLSGAPSAGFGSLWLRGSDTITRYDPSKGQTVARIPIPHLIAITFGDDRVWALSQSANSSEPSGSAATLTQIDPRTNRIVGTPTHRRTPQPIAVAVSGHDLWIADFDGRLLHFKLTHH